ncbi:MAG: hypothetical protein HeimC2_32530 [Candidatus Heimdallarchaeota archaeon LC_2]|nr:MAG: hypothetical protein HeimC2_32530 [Candidatus Heimdallarchaeota archaeon LC_2]
MRKENFTLETIYKRAERQKIPKLIINMIFYNFIILSSILIFWVIDKNSVIILSTSSLVRFLTIILFLMFLIINYVLFISTIIEYKHKILHYTYNPESNQLNRIITIKDKQKIETYDLSEIRYIRVIKYQSFDYSGWRLGLVENEDFKTIITSGKRNSDLVGEGRAISKASGIPTDFPNEI